MGGLCLSVGWWEQWGAVAQLCAMSKGTFDIVLFYHNFYRATVICFNYFF